MSRFKIAIAATLMILAPFRARADLFGGDILVLTQILAQSVQTVLQLRSMLANGADTLDLLREVNSGVRSGLDLIRVLDPKANPGTFGDLHRPEDVLQAVEAIYGAIPKGPSHDLIQAQDQSVAEVISMNRTLYDYADSVDRERERILFHANLVSPQGAGKLQNQALGILIGVTTQLLRTQSQMLKLMGQTMAVVTRKEKFSAENFQTNYGALSDSFSKLPRDVKLPKLGGSK